MSPAIVEGPAVQGQSVGDTHPATQSAAGRIAAYRQVREEVERSILPVATSVDGATFDLQASLYGLALRRGGYVVLGEGGTQRLGQVADLRADTATADGSGTDAGGTVLVRLARGTGVVLDGDGEPFHQAVVRPATPGEVADWSAGVSAGRPGLAVGELLLAPGVPMRLDARGLGRHTFMCGQSGSGKTYSLGVLLERVLTETTLRVVILDPNSDFVGLARVRGGAEPAAAARYAPVTGDILVWGDGPTANRPLHLTFADLDRELQGAVLGLDPVRDREEYTALTDLLEAQQHGRPLVTRAEDLLETDAPGARLLGLRARNLGVLGWRLWDPRSRSLVRELREPSARCTVVDLGSLDTLREQRLVAAAVLSTLWQSRAERNACLVVVDEAHNVCAAEPEDEISALSSQHAVRIAAEGRKYGLYLLTSTQRPHKVHENVVSQCDNLLLMRMNSQADLADLARTLSFVPPGLVYGATAFGMGQALVAGRISPQAAYVQMGTRVSEEGGADVPATWAAPRVQG